tara:strand:+ start:333 stop:779 length:447 start_codon:yes stop_codon:yes gene_type:complete
MTTTTPTKPNHALTNCKGQLENIIELYELRDVCETAQYELYEKLGLGERDIEEEARDMALDVCWKSDDWQAVGAELTPTKGRVLLSTGGPACQVICNLDGDSPSDPEIQWQDWGTPWTTPSIKCELELDFDTANDALEWFINLFYWGV